MTTDPGDLVLDPFAGSCVTGEVAERLGRRWVCADTVEEYLTGALGRFQANGNGEKAKSSSRKEENGNFYKVPRPGILWNGIDADPLCMDGGRTRPKTRAKGKLSSGTKP